MKRFLLFLISALVFSALPAFGQATLSPNVGFQIPAYQQTNWQIPIDNNFAILDTLLGGYSTLPTGTTPSTGYYTNWVTANTVSTTITNFAGGFQGQKLTLICGPGDAYSAIAGSPNIRVDAAWACSSSTSISLVLVGSVWQEVSRAGGGGGGGGGGITSLNGLTAAAQVFANDANVAIISSGFTQTITWQGTLAAGRLNPNVVQSVVNDMNVAGSISAQTLTLSWTGVLSAGRLNANVVQVVNNDTNVTGSISGQTLTLGWTGPLPPTRGGTGTSGALSGIVRGGNPMTAAEVSGDASTNGSNVLTFASVNGNVGSFANASITVNAKGLVTAASSGSIYNQTLYDGGAAETQRAGFNFIAGTNMTVSCVDNSGAGRTDCTFISSATSATAFSALTSATNTQAAMLIGTGASLDVAGSGTINATTLLDETWAAPGAIGGTTPAAAAFTTISATGHVTLSGLLTSGTIANAICSDSSGHLIANASGNCYSGGTSIEFETNSSDNSSQTILNLINSAAFNGLTFTFTNTTAGTVQAGFSGTLGNAGLTNPATTVNNQTCTLGAGCTVPFATNGSNNTSQSGINHITSTANATGLVITPSNPATNQEKYEITGQINTANVGASGLSGTAPISVATSGVISVSTATTGALGVVQLAGDLGGTGASPSVLQVHGVAYPASPFTNTVPVITASNTVTYEAVPNAALANSATTVNGQTCTLGSGCTIPIQTNSANNASQAGLNMETSTANAVGLVVTPTNSGTNVEKWEVTGASYTGNAATATALASTPAQCSGGQFSTGIAASGNANCSTPSGSGTVNNASQYAAAYYSASGTTNTISGISAPTAQNVTYVFTSTPSGGAAQAPAWSLPGVPFDAQTGTSYTVANTDRQTLVTTSNTSAIAVALPQSGAGNFTNNFNFALANINTGLVTITPTTSTINGNATQIVPNNWWAFAYGDNTNYRAGVFPSIAAFPNCAAPLDFASATGVFACLPLTSGGVPYGSAANTWASSGALTQYGVVFGGGAGGAPTSSAQGASNAPLIGQGAANPIFSTILYPTSLTSGGIICGTSTTQLASSALLTSNVLPKGGGAGACPSNSSITDNGTTVTTTDSGGYVGVSYTASGTTAGFFDYPEGSTSAAVAPCNVATSICEEAPPTVTSYLVIKPGVAANGVETNNVASAVDTQGFSGDANHAAVVTTGSGTSVSSTTFCSSTYCPAGTYVVSVYVDVTTACGTTGTYTVNLIYTDDQGSKTIPVNINGTGAVPTTGVLTTTSTANFGENAQVVRLTSGNLNYSTTAVACGSAGPMVGKLYLSAVPMQ